jgi:hypothetical protein
MVEHPASWVYAVVPASTASLPGVTGVADEPVRLVTHGDIAAVTGSVDAADVDEEAWRRRLNDLAWLERAARSHHRVVARYFETAPTVPFRLATVYHDDQRVADMLAHRDRELAHALATIARRAEWGVQAFSPPHRDQHDHPPAVDHAPARPGTAYLMRRRAQRSAAETRRRSAAEAAEEVHAAFQRLAAAAARTPPTHRPAGHPGGQEGRMVLNAAYLIDDDRRDEVARATRELGERHPLLRLRVTGPWPAYSFVEIGEEVPA